MLFTITALSCNLRRKPNLGAFLQSVMVWDDIGQNGRIQAEFSMTEEIAQLREAGLVVYAAARNHIFAGGVGAPSPWLVAYVVIRRSDDKSYP